MEAIYKIENLQKRALRIGYRGEHEFREVKFDAGGWLKDHPEATFTGYLEMDDGRGGRYEHT